MKVTTPPCPCCHKTSELEVEEAEFRLWRAGLIHVQDAFPNMSVDNRELLMTGTHPDCWDAMFGEEEDDD
jgi:hypothetical protein